MSDKYSSALRKIARAKHHVGEIDTMIDAIPRDSYSVAVESNSGGTHHRLRLIATVDQHVFSPIFGDAVTNLRAALDHCFAAAVNADGTKGQVFFPIRDTRGALIAALKSRKNKWSASDQLRQLIVEEIQPYVGGHPTLCALNKLANTDKHRFLMSTISIASALVSFRQGGVTFDNCIFTFKGGEDFIISQGNQPIELYDEPKPSLAVLIGEEEPAIFFRKNLVPTLNGLADDVAAVVDAITAIDRT